MRFYTKLSPIIILGVFGAFAIYLFLNGSSPNEIIGEIFDTLLRR